jgi:protease-4
METYTRSSLSAADRTQYNAYLDDIFNLTKATVMKARSWKEADFNAILNREFLYSAAAARARGLVDATGRAEAVEQMIRELEGTPVLSYSLYGDADASLMNQDHIASFYSPGDGFALPGTAAHIAIVYASGETDLDRAMNTRNLARIIREQADKSRV